MATKTVQLFVRILESTYDLVKQNCGGDRALGAYINQAVLNYANQPVLIASAVLKAFIRRYLRNPQTVSII